MNFATRETVSSAIAPGVRFTVKRLNVIQRTRRDATTIEKRATYDVKSMERARLWDEHLGGVPQAEMMDKYSGLAGDVQSRLAVLSEEADALFKLDILPVVLRAGLLAVEGFTVDDQPATVEQFIEAAPEELLFEAYQFCQAAAQLSEEERKNLQLPGTSAGLAAGNGSSSIAGFASAQDSITNATV